ncbi:MAG: ABC transporter ATP-binding protein [Firmicutes bacterium]|nr:ABC transporter ATP-binding protein [Bacillota bacterium]
MLKVKDLNVYYNKIHALNNVSIQVGKGQIVALIGSNGAGKSTLLNSIAGVKEVKSGDIVYMDQSMLRMDAEARVKKGVILAPEGRQIFPKFTVWENLTMGAFTVKDREIIEQGYERVYKLFPLLKERTKQLAATLSGGEQQMLAIGRALMGNPKLLMLDEPSLGLAPIFVEQIFELLTEIRAQGTTLLLIEQNAMAALEVADRAYVLETGNIVMEGTGQDLLHNDLVIKSYLGG